MIIHLGLPLPTASSVLPNRQAGSLIAVLFGLATGGVYTASPVTRTAVGFYPAISPLPVFPKKPSAVCFLLHYSIGLHHLAVSQHLALCCPDFPPVSRNQDKTGKPAITCPTLMNTKLSTLWISSSALIFFNSNLN